MQLTETLRFHKAKIHGSLATIATEDGLKSVMVLHAPIGRDQATALGMGFAYLENGTPRAFSEIKSEEEIESLAVELPHGTSDSILSIQPEKISGLRIAPVEELGLHLMMRVHVTDQHHDLLDFLKQRGKKDFVLTLRPNNLPLFGQDGQDGQEKPKQEPIQEHLRGDALAAHQAKTGALASVMEMKHVSAGGKPVSIPVKKKGDSVQ